MKRVRIESLGNRVGGIARPEGEPAVFVRGALPGEEVTVRIVAERKSYREAELTSVEKPSPSRIEPFCPHFGTCGGCSLQHAAYQEELIWKREWIEKAFRKLRVPHIESVIPSPVTRGYRNRTTFDVHSDNLTLHAFRGDPVPVENCPLMNRNSLEALSGTLPGRGSRVSARGAENTTDRALEYFEEGSWIREGSLFERLSGLLFPVPAGGFFQVNTPAAEILQRTVTDMIPEGIESALDLYGGAGTFGLPLALRGTVTTSVEMNGEASMCCREAMQLNGIPEENLRVVCARDRNFLSNALSKKLRFDLIVLDPPRAGAGIRTARQLRRLMAPWIVYVSCNPFSAARDIAILTDGGYRIRRVIPVDMFPRTDHVETVILLEGNCQ